jgi:hypothetical protein
MHRVMIRVLLLKRQEHHLNALAGNFPAFLSNSIIFTSCLSSKFLHPYFVEVSTLDSYGDKPTCSPHGFYTRYKREPNA